MLKYEEYKKKFCKGLSEPKAYRMYCMYLEASIGSDDFKKKDSLPINDFYKAKEALEKANCPMTTMNITYDQFVQFAPFPQQVCNPVPCNPTKQKGNNPMYIDNDKKIESSKINYLNDRLENVYYRLDSDLPKQFGMTDDDAPATTTEFIERMTSGKFTIKNPDKKDEKGFFYRPLENIRWRDPAKKEDKEGALAASKELQKAYQDARDQIVISDPKDGLAAVQKLEAWTPTVGNA